MKTPERQYWHILATVSIRRLWPLRADPLARVSLHGWVSTLRQLSSPIV